MQHYKTADYPRLRRTASWNDLYADRFADVTFVPTRSEFDAELRVGSLGLLGMADIRTSSAHIERTPLHISRSNRRLFSFLVLVEGAAHFSHYGNETALAPGDITLCDNAAPHRIRFETSSRFMVLRATPALLRRHLPCPEQQCGLGLAGDVGITQTVSTTLGSLWSDIERGLPDAYGDRVAGQLLDLIGTAYAMAPGDSLPDSSLVGSRKAQARQYIEHNLQDPELNSVGIAQGLRISPRYLRMLFADGGENVSAYILRRRLEECAREIVDPAWRDHTITEIAFRWGFNSSAYFARSFRDRHGMTATEYRRRHDRPH